MRCRELRAGMRNLGFDLAMYDIGSTVTKSIRMNFVMMSCAIGELEACKWAELVPRLSYYHHMYHVCNYHETSLFWVTIPFFFFKLRIS